MKNSSVHVICIEWFFIECQTVISLYGFCIAGAASLKARPAVTYSRGEVRGSPDVLRKKFEDYCIPKNNIPLENNPFYTCVERVGENTHNDHAI